MPVARQVWQPILFDSPAATAPPLDHSKDIRSRHALHRKKLVATTDRKSGDLPSEPMLRLRGRNLDRLRHCDELERRGALSPSRVVGTTFAFLVGSSPRHSSQWLLKHVRS